ncbi:hypothetical protein C8R44DRAFT_796190 [Mycena epipterygia]|nr:hypothetical protein C8R44DRAFT_796190 [Mycena epipterygia]
MCFDFDPRRMLDRQRMLAHPRVGVSDGSARSLSNGSDGAKPWCEQGRCGWGAGDEKPLSEEKPVHVHVHVLEAMGVGSDRRSRRRRADVRVRASRGRQAWAGAAWADRAGTCRRGQMQMQAGQGACEYRAEGLDTAACEGVGTRQCGCAKKQAGGSAWPWARPRAPNPDRAPTQRRHTPRAHTPPPRRTPPARPSPPPPHPPSRRHPPRGTQTRALHARATPFLC